MKKLKSLFLVALLALGANVSAQEETAGAAATGSSSTAAGAAATGATIGGIATTTVVIGAVAVGVAAAVIANQDDDGDPCAADEIEVNGQCVCPDGQVKFNGICTTQELVCNDPRGGALNDSGDLCVIPAGTLVNGVTITTTITYLPTLFP